MRPFLFNRPSLENKLIGHILRDNPQACEIIERHFGWHCLKKPDFRIQTLEMACILFNVDLGRLLQEFKEVQSQLA